MPSIKIDDQCTLYLDGDGQDRVQVTAPTCSSQQLEFPNRLPIINVDLSLTPGYFSATALLNGRKYQTYVYCNGDQQSQCFLMGLPGHIRPSSIQLQGLDYLGQSPSIRSTQDQKLQDFVESITQTTNICRFLKRYKHDSQVMPQLVAILEDMIRKRQVDPKYLEQMKAYPSIAEYARDLLRHTT